jgi:hypothetical protein
VPGATLQFALPSAESGKVYAPADMAWRIENFKLTPEGTLRSIRGPAPIIPDYGQGYPYNGRVHCIFHALLDNGMRDVLLIRSGTILYAQSGWTRGLETLETGLSDDPLARYPDVAVEVGGKIVWSNGIDAPLVYDGYTVKTLGHERIPGAPTVLGPGDTGHPAFRNNGGYSHPGKVGIVGDVFTTDSGAMLDATWTYFVQLEDVFGDLSPLSSGTSAKVRQENTQGAYWPDYSNYPGTTNGFLGIASVPRQLGLLAVGFDDLTRQFALTDLTTGTAGVVARHIWRTKANDPVPRFLARIPDRFTTVFIDNTPDANLGPPAREYIVPPRFSIACSYQGCLVVFEAGTNRLRISEPGFPGTFERTRYVDIDSDGAIGSGLAVFGGKLYAWTGSTMFYVENDAEGVRAQPVPQGRGCEAPQSIDTTDEGLLLWMGQRAWYAMTADEVVTRISDTENKLFFRLNAALLGRAVGRFDPNTRQYICFVPEAGSIGNALGMVWDGRGWRRYRLGLTVETMCITQDWRMYALIGGRNSTENNVWALDREVASYTPPTKTYLYRSAWIRLDPTGRTTANYDTVHIGVVEASNRAVTYTVWKDDNRDTSVDTGTLTMVDPSTTELLNTIVIGTGKFHNPRLTWYRFDTRLIDARSFAFDLSCDDPTFLELAAFAFDAHIVDPAGARENR